MTISHWNFWARPVSRLHLHKMLLTGQWHISYGHLILWLMAICHWLRSMTKNLWTLSLTAVNDPKKCHWPRSMTFFSVIDRIYSIWGHLLFIATMPFWNLSLATLQLKHISLRQYINIPVSQSKSTREEWGTQAVVSVEKMGTLPGTFNV